MGAHERGPQCPFHPLTFAAYPPGTSALASHANANRHSNARSAPMAKHPHIPPAAQYGASASRPPVSLSDHAMRSESSVGL